jgi:hypothetical protein
MSLFDANSARLERQVEFGHQALKGGLHFTQIGLESTNAGVDLTQVGLGRCQSDI